MSRLICKEQRKAANFKNGNVGVFHFLLSGITNVFTEGESLIEELNPTRTQRAENTGPKILAILPFLLNGYKLSFNSSPIPRPSSPGKYQGHL